MVHSGGGGGGIVDFLAGPTSTAAANDYFHGCGSAGGLLRCKSYVLRDIPVQRATNPTFWFLATRSLCFPSKLNSCKTLYEKLLPFLNRKPLLANEVCPGSTIPRGGDPSRAHLVLEAVHQVQSPMLST